MTCNDIAKEIWEFCIQKGIHLSAAHIPGMHNFTVDVASLNLKTIMTGCYSYSIY